MTLDSVTLDGDVLNQVRYTFRSLRGDLRLSLLAILTLALGISLCTVVFSVVYNSFFDALPYKHFRRSVVWQLHNMGRTGDRTDRQFFGAEEIRAFREQNHVFEETIAYIGIRVLYDDGVSSRYWPRGTLVSVNAFDYLGVPALVGRGISEDDGKPDAPPVLVMSYKMWQAEFGGDPKIIGKTFVLDGTPTTVIGIMPPRFNAFGAKFWLPASLQQLGGGSHMMGRLKTGASVQAAAADLDAIAHHYQRPPSSPGHFREQSFPEEKFVIVAETLLDSLIGNFSKALYVLLGSVLLLMMVACSNVANLLLARATARELEMAMRAALGASRWRLIRHLLGECFVLTATASVAGCALAYWGVKLVVRLIPDGTLPDQTAIRMNLPVLLLTLGLSALTIVLCGLAPVFHILHGTLQPRLIGSHTSTTRGFRLGAQRGVLVVSEVALSIVLLIGAGLLMRSFFVLTRVNLGFDPRNTFYFVLDLPPSYTTNHADSLTRKNALTSQLLDRLRTLPGVTLASEQNNMPPLESEISDTIIPGRPHSERWETAVEECSESYFQVLGLPLLRGRLFSKDDVAASRYVVVVNEAFSRQYFPSEDPLGQKVRFELFDRPYLAAPRDAYFEIIGVVRGFQTRDYDKRSWQILPQAFMPYSIANYSWRSFMVRSAIDTGSLLKTVDEQMQALDPGVRISNPGTVESALREFYRGPQFELLTLTVFSAIGLVFAVLGIFSVMAYVVSLRTREIGIRIALGARRADILRLVVSRGFGLVAIGTLVGLFVSYALTRFLVNQISGISVTDPITFAAVALLAVSVGVAACLVPARRAALVDPMVALRCE